MLGALKERVFINSVYCWADSEVALCWIKGKEKCWKPWVENRVVIIRNVVDKDKWYHISGKNNPADIPTRICKLNDFERWFEGPQFLYSDVDVSKFDVDEKMKLVEAVVQNEAKVGKKVDKNVNSVNILTSDFSDGAGHVIDKDLNEGSGVVFDVAVEHVNILF